MMLKLKDLHSPDFDINSAACIEEQSFRVVVQAEIGDDSEKSRDIYSILFVSRDIANSLTNDAKDNKFICLPYLSSKIVEQIIIDAIEKCNNSEEPEEELTKIFDWEFDRYQIEK